MSDETETPGAPQEPAGAEDGAPPAAESEAPVVAGAEPAEAAGKTVEELAEALAATRDQMLRAAADAENMRKRAERDVADARAYSVTGFARDLLSVADNLARALDSLAPEAREGMGETGRTLLDGVEITQKELHAALARHGVKPIEVGPGSAFDPNLHQAAAQIPSDKPAGTVAEVLQHGWTIGDRVLRASMVAVSAGPGGAEGSDSGAPGPGASVDTKV